MTVFEDFFLELSSLVEKYEKGNLPLKLERDQENEIINIFGEKTTSMGKAKNGLNYVSEMAYTVAEHHPYWNILYQSSDIANTVLEKWNGKLSREEISEIEWSLKQISQTIENIKEKT